MSKSFDVRVPIELLTDTRLTRGDRAVWMAVRSHQGKGKHCKASLRKIGERCPSDSGEPMDKGNVSKHLKRLAAHGWMKRVAGRKLICKTPIKSDCAEQCAEKEKVVTTTTLRKNRNGESCNHNNSKLLSSQQKVVTTTTPSENQKKTKRKTNLGKSAREKKKSTSTVFRKPSLDDATRYMKEYCVAKHFRVAAEREAEKWFDHFESNGWKVGGKAPMKNWQASIRNWARNCVEGNFDRGGTNGKPASPTRRNEPMYKPWKPSDSSDFNNLFR